MPQLKFTWVAEFSDHSTIAQFTPDNQEILFKEVQARFSDLILFTLTHTEKSLVVKVDLTQGIVYVNDVQQPLGEPEVKTYIRLIFFRRHRHEMNMNGHELGHSVFYFIGFQYLDDQGNNVQKSIQLDQEGNILIS